MRRMLQTCDAYAAEFSINFNANKSKCLIAAPIRRRYLLNKSDICLFSVGGKAIEFVDFFVHLGHIISSDLDDCRDVANRRCSFTTLTINRGLIVAQKGSKYLHSRTSGNCETITIITAVNSAGAAIPPHVTVKGKTRKSPNYSTLQQPPQEQLGAGRSADEPSIALL